MKISSGRVGHRGQRVAREDGEGDPLRKKGLAKLGAAELAPEQDPLGDISNAHTARLEHSRATPEADPLRVRGVHVVIMGCGRVGSTLARSLEDRNHTVSIIDSNPDAFRRLGPSFNGTKVTGYGFDQAVLTEAGIERADAFAAVSSGDNSNIIAARVARETFGIQQVVARIYDPGRAEVYQRLGHHHRGHGEVDRRPGAAPDPAGRRRARLPRPLGHDPGRPGARSPRPGSVTAPSSSRSSPTCRIAWIDRLGEGMLPSRESVLQEGDLLHLVMREEKRQRRLRRAQEGSGGRLTWDVHESPSQEQEPWGGRSPAS